MVILHLASKILGLLGIMFLSLAYNLSSFAFDIEFRIREFNNELESIENGGLGKRRIATSQLVKIIKFHVETKQLSTW